MAAWTILCGSPIAWSATYTWDSTATGTSWNVASNWGGAVPGSADIGLFSAGTYTAQPSLTSTAGVGGIWDTGSGSITIGGTTLAIAGTDTINGNPNTGIELDLGAGPLTINAPLVLQNSQQWINYSASPLTINGNFTAAGNLTMSGSGMVTLTGSNTLGGSLTVDGGTLQTPGGSLSAASNGFVGNAVAGALVQSGGSNSFSFLYLGYQNGSNGSYNLSGSGQLSAANIAVGYAGNGSFTQTGGSNSISSFLYVGRAGGNGSYSLNGNGLLSGQFEIVGYSGSGSFLQAGGTNLASGFLALGQNLGSTGSYTLTAGGLQSAGQEVIGQSGSGTFTQSGGTNSFSTIVYLGNTVSGSGVYNLSGSGLLTGQSEFVGYSGSGVFTQTGGTNLVSSTLAIGNASGGAGIYNLSGSGLLSSATETIGNSGTGVFTQTGGTNTISGGLYLSNNPGSSGTYNLFGGLLVLSSINQGAGAGAFNFTGGTLTGGTAALTISTPVAPLILTGQVSGSGGLIKTGSSILVLAGNNTYSGNTVVSQGALLLSRSNAVQNSTIIVGVNNGLLFSPSIGTFDVGSIGGTGNLLLADTGGHPITLVTGGNNVNTTFSGIISGLGVLVHNGSGTLVLAGANTYSGGTILGPDALVVSNSGSAGTGSITFAGDATLSVTTNLTIPNAFVIESSTSGTVDTAGYTVTLGGPISGAGNLEKAGSGTLILTNSNSYSGVTSISQGTLELASAAAVQNSTVGVYADNGLQFSPGSGTFGVGGLSGSNALTLNDTSGGPVTLAVGGNNANTTYSGAISGSGSLLKEGSGMLALTGSNSFTGGLVLDPGIVSIKGDAALGTVPGSPSTNITFAANSTLQALGSFALATNRNIAISTSCTATLDTNGNNFTIGGNIGGPGALAVVGSGTLVLTNSNTLTGGTTIGAAAALQLGNGGSTGWLNGNIVDNGLLVFDRSDSPTFSGAISGSGSVEQAGTGTVLLGGANSFTGSMILQAGILELSCARALQNSTLVLAGGALNVNNLSAVLGGLAGSGDLALAGGSLTIGGNDGTSTYAGSLSGTCAVIKTGNGMLALTGSSSFAGGTTLAQGILSIGSDAALGAVPGSPSTNITFAASSTLQAGGSFALATNRNIAISTSSAATLDTQGNTLTIGGLIGGPGALAVVGGGTLVLTAAETFTGGTTINAATLQLGNGGSTGWVNGNILDNGLLVFDRSDSAAVFSATISGSGGIQMAGTGTLLFGGTNTFTGTAILSSGILELGNATALQNATVVPSGGTLNLNGFNATLGSLGGLGILSLTNGTLNIGGNGNSTNFAGTLVGLANLIKSGSGICVLSGNNSFSGLTTINAGTLEASTTSSIPGLFNPNQVNVAPGGLLAVGVGGAQQWTAANINALLGVPSLFGSGGTLGIDTSGGNFTDSTNLTGAGVGVVKLGSNTLTFTGTNSYTGGTLVSSGALEVTSTSALPFAFTAGKVSVAAGATLTLAVGGPQGWTPGNISNLLQVNGLFSPGSSLGVDTNGGSFILGSTAASSAGLTVIGSNSVTLTGSNSFLGVTNLSQGTLQLANSAALTNSTVTIDSDDGLQFSANTGTFYLGGLAGGNLLQLADTAGNAVALVVEGNGASTTFSGEIIGNGSLTKAGAGILVLSGSDSYRGGTTVEAGTLCVAGLSAIANGTSLNVGAGGAMLFAPAAEAGPVVGSPIEATAGGAVAAVPEPGTLALLVAAGLAVGFWSAAIHIHHRFFVPRSGFFAGRILEMMKLLAQQQKIYGDACPLSVANPKKPDWSPEARQAF